MRPLHFAFLLLILIPTRGLADSKKYLGIGVGIWGLPTDSHYEVNKNSIPIPFWGGLSYFSVEIPFLLFRKYGETMNFRLGINNHSLNYREITTSFPQEDQKKELSYEVSILTLYLTYLSEKMVAEDLRWYFELGPTLIESVLTEALETYKLSTSDDGSQRKKHQDIQKKYQIDYGVGAMFSTGITYQLASSDMLGIQLSHFYQQSDLSFKKDDNVNLSNTQLRVFYLFAFN